MVPFNKHLKYRDLKCVINKQKIPLAIGLFAGLLTGILPTSIANVILLLFLISMAIVYWKLRSGISVLFQFVAFSAVIAACILAPLKPDNKKVDLRGVGAIKLGDLELLEKTNLPSLYFPKEMQNLEVNIPDQIVEVKEILEFIDIQAGATHAVGICGWDYCSLLFGCQSMGRIYFRPLEKS